MNIVILAEAGIFLYYRILNETEESAISTENKLQLPWWQKYTLSLTESAEYFGINYKTLAKFVDEHKDEKFILWNGSRAKIKRHLFEQYVDEHLDAI